MVIVAAEGLGWNCREAAGQRAAAGWRGCVEGLGWSSREAAGGDGGGGCCRGAAEAREYSGMFSVHSGVMLTLMLGGELDVWTWA